MLSRYRVLDLTDERGHLAAELMAGFGAEVILVEPPGGSSARSVGPFAGDDPSEGTSLTWLAHNRGKRSVVLDLETSEGRNQLRQLAAGADFLFESLGPGTLAAQGLGYADLAGSNPALIYVSISAFGSDGPKANWAASDLVVAASAGQLALTGDEDRPPVRMSLPQAYYHASVEAVGAALIALHERQTRSGLGQHVDCSAQASMLQTSQSWMLAHPVGSTYGGRVAGGLKVGPVPLADGTKLGPFHIQLMWPCRDGHVSATFLFGVAISQFTQNLMNWVHEEGFCDEATRDKDWVNYAVQLFTGVEPHSEYLRLKRCLHDFFATKTKAELFAASFERRVLLAPVTTTQEVLDSEHFASREFWEEVDGRHLPGPIAKFSDSPCPPLGRPPELGQDTSDVLAAAPRVPYVTVAEPRPTTDQALSGLKVLDFMWVMAGPAGSRVLADYGAEIVRVESTRFLDGSRTLQPYVNNSNHPDESAIFHNLNANKKGICLDLSAPAAKDVVYDLVRWADVVLESYSVGSMRQWGFDYETLTKINPNLVMLSSCLMGQVGLHSSLAGFGTMASAISGFFNITGWPDRSPCGPLGAYTDYISPRFLVASVMAALEHRRETGRGQYIDFSQAEASMRQLTPALLDTQVNRRIFPRLGNDDPWMAPHGVYPAAGDDCWIAVAVATDEQWHALCRVLARHELAGLTPSERLQQRVRLDELVSGWTAGRKADDAMVELQAAGVPAHTVQNTFECFHDPQLRHRDYFVQVPHGSLGTTWVENTRFRLSRTPAHVRHAGPTLGEHTSEVLSDILGYDDGRIADLAAAEALE
jgi:crotonobetainyl-CoA:carnitine CoA-transferase CaiB-like acyl-CoA transferase